MKPEIPRLCLTALLACSSASAQGETAVERDNPYACIGFVRSIPTERRAAELEARLAAGPETPIDFCIVAELMERLGNYEAEEYYERAIVAGPQEPAYELFYGDYLRNFRGADGPLFPQAEEQYYRALAKLAALREAGSFHEFDAATEGFVTRGLVALYERDGMPLVRLPHGAAAAQQARPAVLFSSINRYGEQTGDFNEIDDVRSFTSEALFAGSAQRLNRPLTNQELRGIIRRKEQFETINRLRFRHGALPVLDLSYRHQKIDDAQITNFFEPNSFNDLKIDQYAIALEKPFDLAPFGDLLLRGAYSRIDRKGLIEFLEDEKENIDEYEIDAAFSRFFGPDKATLQFVYVSQDIDQDIPDPPDRDRDIIAASIRYLKALPEIDLYDNRFQTRGLELAGGFLHDQETFGDVDVTGKDFFFGANLKGFSAFEGLNPFDVALQGTVFTSDVEGDPDQDNTQLRTDFSLLYRIVDEEKTPGIPERFLGVYPAFLHLTLPLRYDAAIDGPDDYENVKAGIQLSAKFFLTSWLPGPTFLATIRYDYQRFVELDKDLNLFLVSLSMGF